MQIVPYLDNIISNTMLEAQIEDKKTHPYVPKLSGSVLGNPLQWQILGIIGVPTVPFEPVTLRKFERGHQVEDWITKQMPGVLNGLDEIAYTDKDGNKKILSKNKSIGQFEIEYRHTMGHIDAIVDMAKWDQISSGTLKDLGVIPHEVKSITNMDFNHMKKTGLAKYNHLLQICLYAMAMNVDHFMIHYVASDDFRVFSFLYSVEEYHDEVEHIIDEVQTALKKKIIPAFVPRLAWQANPMYQNFPTWADLSPTEAKKRLKKDFPEQYKRLQTIGREVTK